MLVNEYDGAADDAETAEVLFKDTGDKIRRTIAAADGALANYGAGRIEEAVGKMRYVFKSRGLPASNNPDDIALLQELSLKDAELHVAYAAHSAFSSPVASTKTPPIVSSSAIPRSKRMISSLIERKRGMDGRPASATHDSRITTGWKTGSADASIFDRPTKWHSSPTSMGAAESLADATGCPVSVAGSYWTSAKLCVGCRNRTMAGTSTVEANSTRASPTRRKTTDQTG